MHRNAVPTSHSSGSAGPARATLLLMAGLMLGACSQTPPEERLEQAADKLADTTQDLSGVNNEIERLEGELESLRKDRQRLQARQRTLKERVAARATDVALFRTIQSDLLAVEALQDTAIAVTVEDQTVTLRGRVNSTEQRDRAVSTAQNAPGVAGVKSRILIDDEATPVAQGDRET